MGAVPSFVFLWVGAGEGLEEGRATLRAWGYRRCEDICWIKTNTRAPHTRGTADAGPLLQHTKVAGYMEGERVGGEEKGR